MRPLGRLGEKSSWNSITCLVRPDVQTHGARTIWTAQNKVMQKSVKGETIPKCFGVDEWGEKEGSYVRGVYVSGPEIDRRLL